MFNTYIYPMVSTLNLQLFAEAGDVVNKTTDSGLSPTMKEFYNTELLENAREKLVFQQLGRKQTLPANHGKIVEWRKWETLPDADQLTEGVIPEGKNLGMTKMNVEITQHGQYVTISDQLELHAVDDAILGATEELGAASGKTFDKLVRNELMKNANVIFADVVKADGTYVSTPESRSALATALGTSGQTAKLTPTMINRAVTKLRKANVPYYSGNKYVAVVHPSVAYDLRDNKDWNEFHKYAATEQIFNGEIGELHGVRFVESTLAPIVKQGDKSIYLTMFFGKDAFGVVDPSGATMETIIKGREQAGGPLNQFSTVGNKFSMAAKVLYPERMVTVESSSFYNDAAN